MAVRTHIVNLGMVNLSSTGTVINKTTATIKEVAEASSSLRVLPSSSVSNSASYPTIEDYIAAEAASDYILGTVNQSFIVTYHKSDF